VHSGGPIPAFDVTVLIENTGRCDELLPQTRDRALATGVGNVREQYFPAIVPRMVFRLAAQFRPSCDEAYYFAYITTRNRTMMQQTLLTKRADRWDQTMRLLDLQSGLELHSFPARAAGATWPDFGPFRDTILRYQEILQSAPAEPL
jgi:hypothetical protein